MQDSFMTSKDRRIKNLPILSHISYTSAKALKYHLSTTKLQIRKTGENGKLHHYKRIHSFISVTYYPTDDFQDLYKFLGKINRVKAVNIDFSNLLDMPLGKEKILSKCFKHLRHIALIKVNAKENPCINDEKVNRICKALTVLRCLKEACFDFFRCYKLSEEGATHVMRYMSKLPILEKLRINYESCHDQSSKGIVRMGEYLRNFKNLKNFAFSICALSVFTSNISEEGFSKFVESLTELKKMEKLYVHFRNCSIRNNNVLRYLSKKISEMPKITALNIHLTGFVKVDDKGFEYLGQNLARMKGLKKLNLDLRSSSEITDDCLLKLCREISHLGKLENLLLNFNACQKVTDTAIKGIGDNILKFPDLQVLQLQVIGFSLFMPTIGEEGLIYLVQQISQLSKLRALGLDIGNSPLLDDDFTANFFGYIIKLQNLVKFQLNVENLSKLTDASLKTIATQIAKLPYLEAVDFCFQNCYNFTDEGVTTFMKRLEQNQRLREIRLGFLGITLSQEVIAYGKKIALWKE